jgi:protein involved in polysaccharide export with SLBB domain
MDEFVGNLEQQMARHPASADSLFLANAPAGMQAPSGREIIGRLRATHATGRIVLNLSPNSSSVDDLPSIALEDGDVLVVPPLPESVQVIGAVSNQNAFIFRSSLRATDYLQLAGGPTRDADSSRAFVLRADGSVTGQGNEKSLFDRRFGGERINPGDTIVVPEKRWRPSVLQEVVALAQVSSQFALGAAALNEIK